MVAGHVSWISGRGLHPACLYDCWWDGGHCFLFCLQPSVASLPQSQPSVTAGNCLTREYADILRCVYCGQYDSLGFTLSVLSINVACPIYINSTLLPLTNVDSSLHPLWFQCKYLQRLFKAFSKSIQIKTCIIWVRDRIHACSLYSSGYLGILIQRIYINTSFWMSTLFYQQM